MTRTILSALLVVIAIVVGITAFAWYRTFNGGEAFGGPFSLVDQRGETITEQAFRGQPSAVFFGFTHCPEICPTTLYEMSSWLEELGDETKNIRANFLSF